MRIRLTEPAIRDLDSIEEYIGKDSPRAAAKMVLRVLEAIEGLRQFPHIGRPGRVSGTRELVVSRTPYVAVYAVRDDALWVLRVLHGAQKWPK